MQCRLQGYRTLFSSGVLARKPWSIRDTIPPVVAHLDLTVVVVTGDALYTQRPLSTQIVDAGGDYVWVVNDNQPQGRADSAQLFVPEPNELGTAALPTDVTMARTIEKGHGRIEERVLTTSSMGQDYTPWPYLAP
jgi:hypothetical protein